MSANILMSSPLLIDVAAIHELTESGLVSSFYVRLSKFCIGWTVFKMHVCVCKKSFDEAVVINAPISHKHGVNHFSY